MIKWQNTWSWLLFTVCLVEGVEGLPNLEERKERRSYVDNSEDERRRAKNWSLKKKALNASTKFTHSLKKRGKRKVDIRASSVSIEDLRDAGEESEVHAFRQELVGRDLLPDKHDDYHTMLRLVLLLLLVPILLVFFSFFLFSMFCWCSYFLSTYTMIQIILSS